MLGSLASALIQHERIRTTETKAKRLVPVANKLVTLGKSGSVHARRRALSIIEDRAVVHKLFAEIAPRFAERPGGYTRVVRLGPRQGDAAPMAIIEFVEDTGVGRAPASEEAETKARRLGRRRAGRKTGEKPSAPAPAAAEEPAAAPAEEPAEAEAAEGPVAVSESAETEAPEVAETEAPGMVSDGAETEAAEAAVAPEPEAEAPKAPADEKPAE